MRSNGIVRNLLSRQVTRQRQSDFLSARYQVIHNIEHMILALLYDLAPANRRKGKKFKLSNCIWNDMKTFNPNVIRQFIYKHTWSREHFSLMIFVLAEVHRLLLIGSTCTIRELYYKYGSMAHNQSNVTRAIHDVCCILRTTPWQLGILASSKGLIAGCLRIHMKSGDIIDCSAHKGATLLPQDFHNVDHLESSAAFVLLVEKDTVYAKFMFQNIFETMNANMILLTGKGYPDFGTRAFVKRLHYECFLPIYLVVDADPFGIDILLVYRYGSAAMKRMNNAGIDELACPFVRWLGVHPSELAMMNIPVEPLTWRDERKLCELTKRNSLPLDVQQELNILRLLQGKAEIEEMSNVALNFLTTDYIPNKIKRNIYL